MLKSIIMVCIFSGLMISTVFAKYPDRALKHPDSIEEAADVFWLVAI